MMFTDLDKKLNGRFFTVTNPFRHEAFWKWWKKIPEDDKRTILEPFAGANSIVSMIQEIGIDTDWECYDIHPDSNNKVSNCVITKRDTIESFPTGRKVSITNPPYLAKNSAKRQGIPYRYPEFDDLYKKCIDVMLANCDFVAAIIPESFITAGLWHDRLDAIVSLPCRMFDDTECPVCLAFFSPNDGSDNFSLFVGEEYIGSFSELMRRNDEILGSQNVVNWRMNDPKGNIGVHCIDDTRGEYGIFFTDDFSDWKVSSSNRSFTVVSGLPDGIEPKGVITKANRILQSYRLETKDMFLTSFRGLRKDGRYRRRLDFGTIKRVLNKATE